MHDFGVEITYNDKPKPVFRLLEEMYVEQGETADWNLLSALHYKAESIGVGGKYWRLVFREETIGVCVFCMSKPLLKARHSAFPHLSPGKDTQISNIQRYAVINDNFRVISRFVVDTMYRSSGAAYRFANLASRQIGFKYIDIQSSMSKYNFFAQRAGFEFTKPLRSLYYDKGLKFMRAWFSSHSADQEALMQEFNAMSPAMQKKVEKELKKFYFDHSPLEKTGSRRFYSDGVVENWPVRRTISKIQGLCFQSPLYGFYKNPDFGTPVPKRLPLLAFDCQKPTEPLNLSEISKLPGGFLIN